MAKETVLVGFNAKRDHKWAVYLKGVPIAFFDSFDDVEAFVKANEYVIAMTYGE